MVCRLFAGGKWIRTISTWKISHASFSAFGSATYLMSPYEVRILG